LTVDQFIAVCCLAGCDYIEHINRMGIQTALKLIRAEGDPMALIARLRSEGKFVVPDDYEEQLRCAILTFTAQRVYDPTTKALVTLSPVDVVEDFLGADLAPTLLQRLVAGDLDTRTLGKLRQEAAGAQASPHFAKPPPASQSPKLGRRSKSEPAVRCAKITSYFQLASEPG
jgi:exonuclease-1